MKVIRQRWSFETPEFDGVQILRQIEQAGRVCYKSEKKISDDAETIRFVKSIMTKNHESVLEHVSISVRCVTDRGVTHEMVRHRIASYSQESTRYCNYSNDKFNNEVLFILPVEFYEIHERVESGEEFSVEDQVTNKDLCYTYLMWRQTVEMCEKGYIEMIAKGSKPQLARAVLPNCLKTEIVMTCNLREWRHFFKLRTSAAAHPQMRELATSMLEAFQTVIPVIFDDITPGV